MDMDGEQASWHLATLEVHILLLRSPHALSVLLPVYLPRPPAPIGLDASSPTLPVVVVVVLAACLLACLPVGLMTVLSGAEAPASPSDLAIASWYPLCLSPSHTPASSTVITTRHQALTIRLWSDWCPLPHEHRTVPYCTNPEDGSFPHVLADHVHTTVCLGKQKLLFATSTADSLARELHIRQQPITNPFAVLFWGAWGLLDSGRLARLGPQSHWRDCSARSAQLAATRTTHHVLLPRGRQRDVLCTVQCLSTPASYVHACTP